MRSWAAPPPGRPAGAPPSAPPGAPAPSPARALHRWVVVGAADPLCRSPAAQAVRGGWEAGGGGRRRRWGRAVAGPAAICIARVVPHLLRHCRGAVERCARLGWPPGYPPSAAAAGAWCRDCREHREVVMEGWACRKTLAVRCLGGPQHGGRQGARVHPRAAITHSRHHRWIASGEWGRGRVGAAPLARSWPRCRLPLPHCTGGVVHGRLGRCWGRAPSQQPAGGARAPQASRTAVPALGASPPDLAPSISALPRPPGRSPPPPPLTRRHRPAAPSTTAEHDVQPGRWLGRGRGRPEHGLSIQRSRTPGR